MATRESTPGDCPHCGHVVPAANVLIEYVRDDGRPAAYAECPACADVVRPR
jgi:NAD-dependent SIR2 family protein deacetylase